MRVWFSSRDVKKNWGKEGKNEKRLAMKFFRKFRLSSVISTLRARNLTTYVKFVVVSACHSIQCSLQGSLFRNLRIWPFHVHVSKLFVIPFRLCLLRIRILLSFGRPSIPSRDHRMTHILLCLFFDRKLRNSILLFQSMRARLMYEHFLEQSF